MSLPVPKNAPRSPRTRFASDMEANIWKQHGWRARHHPQPKSNNTVDSSELSSAAQTGRGARAGQEAQRLPTIPLLASDFHQLGLVAQGSNAAVTLPDIQRPRALTSRPARRRTQPWKDAFAHVRSPPMSPQEGLPRFSCSPAPRNPSRQFSVFTFDSLTQHGAAWLEIPRPTSIAEPTAKLHEPELVEIGAGNAHASKFKGVEALAEALVNQCGSLGKLSRSQWETGLCLLRLDCEALCGISSKKLFKMMDDKHKREVTLDAWMTFFKQLEGTTAAELLTEDFGPIRRRSVDLRRAFSAKSSADSRALHGCSPTEDPVDVAAERSRASGQVQQRQRKHPRSSANLPGLEAEDVEAARSGAPDDVPSPVGRDKPDMRFNGWREQARQGSTEMSFDREVRGNVAHQQEVRDRILGERRGMQEIQVEGPHHAGTMAKGTGRFLLEDGVELSEAISSCSSPMSMKFQEALKMGSRHADLRGLNDDELDAMAEQEQLEEELQALDLSGIQALAYVLTAKLRSLKNAFRWFDTNRKGQIAHVSFATGVVLLHIDMERLTGMNASRVFGLMEGEQIDGVVTRQDWDTFFDSVCTGDFGTMLKKANGDGSGVGSLADRAKIRKDKLKNLRAEQVRSSGPLGAKSAESVRAAKRKKSFQRSAAEGAPDGSAAVSQSADADDEEGSTEASQHQNGKSGLLSMVGLVEQRLDVSAEGNEQSQSARMSMDLESCSGDQERRSSMTDSEPRFSAGTHDVLKAKEAEDVVQGKLDKDHEAQREKAELEEQEAFRCRVRRELAALALGESLEYLTDHGTWQTSIIQEVAEEMNLWSHVSEERPGPVGVGLPARGDVTRDSHLFAGAVVLVHNSLDFAKTACEQLQCIQVFDQLEFPTSFSESQRQVVHILATELGLCTHSEGQGSQRRVVAYNMGDLAAEIRRDLLLLVPGESKIFPQSFTLAQQRLVHIIAAELGLWVHTPRSTDSACIEVHNLSDFAQKVRRDLEQLIAGEHLEFPEELSELHRKIVHCIAGELGFVSVSQGEGASRFVVVANLADFTAEIRHDLCNLALEESRDFAPTLTLLQRKVIHELAAEMGLCCKTHDEGDGCYLVVKRLGNRNMDIDLESAAAEEGATHASGSSGAMGQLDAQSTANRGSKMDDDEEAMLAEGAENEESVISRLFYKYATGRYNGERIFLRFPDLREFAEDAKDAMPNSYRRFHAFASDLESIFDDTLQLQIDMGTRTRKGLTLHWFQVFIQKAMRCIGRSVVGFLLALVSSRTQ